MFKKKLKTPLTNLVNLPFECGTFPEILKTANVTPIYKTMTSSPVTSTDQVPYCQTLAKSVKKILCKRLFFFLEK